jgi:hypothetical protein
MKPNLIVSIAVLASGLWSFPSEANAQQALVIKPLAEKRVAELPAGTLFWRIENFPASIFFRSTKPPVLQEA